MSASRNLVPAQISAHKPKYQMKVLGFLAMTVFDVLAFSAPTVFIVLAAIIAVTYRACDTESLRLHALI